MAGGSATERYLEAVASLVDAAAGRRVRSGTVVVGPADREGAVAAVGYFLPTHTAIMCAPERIDRYSALVDDLPDGAVLVAEEFVSQAEALGGEFAGAGLNHVIPLGGVPSGDVPPDVSVLELDAESDDDRAVVRTLLAECPDDEVDEAEIDPDALDPRIVVLVDGVGAAVAFASGYSWDYAPEFDDVGVLVRPDARGRGLGRAVVAEYIRRHGGQRSFLYRHDVENAGSAALCRSVGFEAVHRLVAVTVP